MVEPVQPITRKKAKEISPPLEEAAPLAVGFLAHRLVELLPMMDHKVKECICKNMQETLQDHVEESVRLDALRSKVHELRQKRDIKILHWVNR